MTDREIGCPTNAKNLAIYIFKVMVLGDKDYGIYHFTDGEAMTWLGFAKKIIKENNLESVVKIVKDNNYSSFAKRPKYSVLSTLGQE